MSAATDYHNHEPTPEERREDQHSVALRRAQLVVQCATELLQQYGAPDAHALRAHGAAPGGSDEVAEAATADALLSQRPHPPALRLDLTVAEFQAIFQERYGSSFPSLVNRSESSLERARLERRDGWALPKVLLRRGAPPGRSLRRDTE